jgi:dTDP-L-rhamnose 4-epimerase
MMRVLITGGAGFIGSHLADELVQRGHSVRILDSLCPQVHRGGVPRYLNRRAELIHGDVREREMLARAVNDVKVVVHLASAVGVAQSQYEVKHYVDVNVGGTANLADVLIKERHGVNRVILAGSMTAYGEGAAFCAACGPVRPAIRAADQVAAGCWEPACPRCGEAVRSVPTGEACALLAKNVYALTKRAQEDLLAHLGEMCGIACTCVRLFNVYGPRQSLTNPYTGVAAIFISRVKRGASPVAFEDGRQSRDFVWVGDVIRAMADAVETGRADNRTLNLGSGRPTTVLELADKITALMGGQVRPDVTRRFRRGDVRHCTADITAARASLGFEPRVDIDEGLKRLVAWGQDAPSEDGFDMALRELEHHNLLSCT